MAIACNGYTACPSCGMGCNYKCSSETTEWGECLKVPRGELVVRPPLGGGGRFPRGLRPSLGGGRGRAYVPPTSSPNPHYDNRARKQRGRRLRALKRRGWGGVPIPYPTNPHPRSIGAIGGGRGRGGQGFGRGLSQSNIKSRYGLGFRG